LTAEKLIKHFGMKALPEEGGYYVKTYPCAEKLDTAALPGRYDGGRFALFGATTTQGFEFSDFEPGTREKLLKNWPGRQEMSERLTRPR